jgi:hypothetical protein
MAHQCVPGYNVREIVLHEVCFAFSSVNFALLKFLSSMLCTSTKTRPPSRHLGVDSPVSKRWTTTWSEIMSQVLHLENATSIYSITVGGALLEEHQDLHLVHETNYRYLGRRVATVRGNEGSWTQKLVDG